MVKLIALGLAGIFVLASCGSRSKPPGAPASASAVDCLTRAMYFESNRSNRDGMIAVGSVVMNRVESSDFPNTICGVVGQKKQFAPGVMSKPMKDSGLPLAQSSALAVYNGERHPRIAKSRFFHAAWYDANFNNIHYVLTTGGNAFYEKRKPAKVTNRNPVAPTEGLTGR